MAWFGSKSYDRDRILAEARRASQKGKVTKAISLYERIREVEPKNTDVLRRLGVLRAKAGQREEARRDCGLAAEQLAKRGFVDQAIGIHREFAAHLPDEVSVWQAIASLELERQRPPDAVGALLEGRRHLRARKHRADALALLRRARQIDPQHFEANFQLAGLLLQEGARRPARRILEAIEPRARTRRDRRRLRARLFRISPTPFAAGRWALTLVGAG